MTTEPLTKPVPVTVSCRDELPTCALVGASPLVESIVGWLELMVNATVAEVPPPGFRTLTKAVPAVAINEAGTKADSWLLLNDVDRAVVVVPLFHWMMEPLTKLVPITVSWKGAPPAAAEDGTSGGVTEGVTPAAMVKVTEFELTGPGF